jgi:hypothetical protein
MHLKPQDNKCKNLLENFVQLVKEKIMRLVDGAYITYFEANPDEDLYHVTFYLSNHRLDGNLVTLGRNIEWSLNSDPDRLIVAYKGHVFTPKKESLMTSYFSRDRTRAPPSAASFYSVLTVMGCVLAVSIIGILYVIRMKRLKTSNKRLNIIYKPAPDKQPII